MKGSRKNIVRLISCVVFGFYVTFISRFGAIPVVLGAIVLGVFWFRPMAIDYPPSKLPESQIKQMPKGTLTAFDPTRKNRQWKVSCQLFSNGIICHSKFGDIWRVLGSFCGNIDWWSISENGGNLVVSLRAVSSSSTLKYFRLELDGCAGNEELITALKNAYQGVKTE